MVIIRPNISFLWHKGQKTYVCTITQYGLALTNKGQGVIHGRNESSPRWWAGLSESVLCSQCTVLMKGGIAVAFYQAMMRLLSDMRYVPLPKIYDYRPSATILFWMIIA